MSPLIFVTVGVILTFTPLSLLASWYLYGLYRDTRTSADDTTAQFAAMLVVLAVSRTFAALLLVIPTLFFVAGIPTPWAGQLILVSLDILLITNVVVAGYLRWLRGKS